MLKDYHRKGIGRKLFEQAKEKAKQAGYSFMQVKTVQMGRYEDYDATNHFYLSLGFKEFEVFPTLWDEWNPCQIYAKMYKFEYIKWYWKYTDDETPVILFYEVDLENERYATRMVEVFCYKSVRSVKEEGFNFVTEACVPSVQEINREPEFSAEIISKTEFEEVYNSKKYKGHIEFPK